MRIAMIGSAYVGLISGACFSDVGRRIICVDLDAKKIAALHAGVTPIFEPGLKELVARNVREERLTFSTNLAGSIADVEAVFIAVGTPSRHGDSQADFSHVYAAAADVALAVKGLLVVIIKSTVPVGTGDEVERICRDKCPDVAIDVVVKPEILREGAAIDDFKRPDRIVVGFESARALSDGGDLSPALLNQSSIVCVDATTVSTMRIGGGGRSPARCAAVNDQRKRAMGRKIVADCGGSVRGKTIAMLGLPFKLNTDDMREAGALSVIATLQNAGAAVRGYDPRAWTRSVRCLSAAAGR